ncbi:GNAT family N-acetyltransferase [Lentzea flaviverrucosa]|uniref:Acetyltransferase (GNAT) family protein n=1 Tax=Lentzea flaviverrucosa TaxID=200379 RepID=A0A1H9R224_9PSEU|nr:GNAT family N-acetyltransferase [Lentzea flaviverrucosa]RDI32858.1 acetyltransferase (GNAT) family protein [Lentzea flaviverrucosa]SER66738.1 Acetyltransferase (GNAT) family protein [Lentzea flaviverrucosa]
MIADLQQVYVERYGDVDVTPVDPAQFAAPLGYFVIGYLDDLPVACGGWRVNDELDGAAEIKRMYVIDSARGKGLSRLVLAHLEFTAREAGLQRMVLETGLRQPEAIALYTSSGYERIDNFGVYRDHPESRCFGKPL